VRPLRSFFAGGLLALVWGAESQASEGVLEINATCAAVGCFAGDAAGLPVEIIHPGSYRLTSTLVTTDPNQTLISITSSEVTLDLGGFALKGPNFCLNPVTTPCSQLGTGVGIDVTSDSDRISLRNGQIEGMGNTCVRMAGGMGQIHGLNIEACGGDGIFIGFLSNVFDNVVRRCAGSGIRFTGSANVHHNISDLNGQAGYLNGDVSPISATLLSDNIATQNGGPGLSLRTGDAYRGNALRANNGGSDNPQVTGGLSLGSNLCGNAACP
jgi:hypothetical protein